MGHVYHPIPFAYYMTQAALKLEAAESYVEEALVRKAAVEAENAAAEARAAEEEAVVSPPGGGRVRGA
jgi:hypothetical protein